MTKYYLTPTDNHKSFYGKAYVLTDGKTDVLYSYDTKILTRNNETGEIVRHWGGWSMTTGRHIAAFCGMNKKEYNALKMAF